MAITMKYPPKGKCSDCSLIFDWIKYNECPECNPDSFLNKLPIVAFVPTIPLHCKISDDGRHIMTTKPSKDSVKTYSYCIKCGIIDKF